MNASVFISHIEPEKEIAIALKNLLTPHFLGLIDFFVSSDGDSIPKGQRWLNTISENLKNCVVQIAICSPQSVQKPWINFEAGAAWLRPIPVIPLCHSGMTRSTLPVPLSLLQAANLTDIDDMAQVVSVLTTALNASIRPTVNFTDFVVEVKAFEVRYTFWDKCNSVFGILAGIHEDIIPALRSCSQVDMDLPTSSVGKMEELAPFLQAHNLLQFHRVGRSSVVADSSGRGATLEGCVLQKLPDMEKILASTNFKPLVQPCTATFRGMIHRATT